MAMSILYLLKDLPLGAHQGKVLRNHSKVSLIEQDDMYACSTIIHVVLMNKNAGILVEQEYMYLC